MRITFDEIALVYLLVVKGASGMLPSRNGLHTARTRYWRFVSVVQLPFISDFFFFSLVFMSESLFQTPFQFPMCCTCTYSIIIMCIIIVLFLKC